MFKSLCLAVGFVLVTAAGTFGQDLARMEQVIQSYVTPGTFMGTVLVARDGNIVLDKAYGMANLEWDVPNTPATKFRLGSLTKQFTAASILLLEERGKLNIDERIKTYLPDQPASWDRITVFNLLTHTSGIPNFTALSEYRDAKLRLATVDATLATLRDKMLDFGPGEKMRYSNSGYLVLGSIIEKVSGQSYEKFITDNIFTPLGMKDSGYYPDTRTVVIALSNVNGPVPDTLVPQLGAIVHGETVMLTTERKETTVPAATLAKYVGAYQLAPTVVITITLDGDHLMAQLTGQGKLQIFPQSETLFFLKVVDAQFEFAADGSSVVLHQNGRDQKANRQP